ncbi:MAG: [FeFe] hydrogenase H-cluster maturation GTPase HydF, partial [Bacteroidales bacterium]|nr:[FeFe] hydrogenase H-cluster maturation GTPase HydF [Bacteroidales bacterium]
MKGNEEKPRIGIFGRRNMGKSTLINYLTGQQVAIVSPTAGTTTDPVRKSMELIGVGPVVWVDTAGIDDEGDLGRLRVEKSYEALPQCNLVLLLFREWGAEEEEVRRRCEEAKVRLMRIYAKADEGCPQGLDDDVFVLSTKDDSLREPLTKLIRAALPETSYRHRSLLGDILKAGDNVVMVCPIDSSAPEGRMILPQVQVLRDVLDNDAKAFVCKETDLRQTLADLREPPRLVVTDSQAFALVSAIVPQEVPLTSFSVVLARAKGLFDDYVEGTPTLDHLRDGDRILMLESCTHDVTCEDIGRVKLPALIRKHSGRQLEFDVVAGLSRLERPVTDYRLVVQCGGCVVTSQQLASRLMPAVQAGVPVSNYGLALAYLNGIFHR